MRVQCSIYHILLIKGHGSLPPLGWQYSCDKHFGSLLLVLSGLSPEVELLNSMEVVHFIFWGTTKLSFQSFTVLSVVPASSGWGSQLYLLSNTCCYPAFWQLHPRGCELMSPCGSICTSLKISVAEHFFMCSSAIFLSLEKCPFSFIFWVVFIVDL